jgi:hypothetical protein
MNVAAMASAKTIHTSSLGTQGTSVNGRSRKGVWRAGDETRTGGRDTPQVLVRVAANLAAREETAADRWEGGAPRYHASGWLAQSSDGVRD